MRAVINAAERLTESVGYMAALLVLPLIAATCYEVFARYVFGAPTIWVYELGYTLTGSHFLLGAALTLKKQGHIRIDLVYARLSEKRKAAIDLVLYVGFFLPFLVLLTDRLFDYAFSALASGERSGASAWNPPIWPFRLVIATGILLLAVQVAVEICKCVTTLRGRGEPRAGEA